MKVAHTCRRDWTDWSCTVSVVVAADADVDAAAEIVRNVMGEVELACSRFRPDSELMLGGSLYSDGHSVSATLGMLVDSALEVARLTDGDVDPTLGYDLIGLGYAGDVSTLDPVLPSDRPGSSMSIAVRRPGWTRVHRDERGLTVPADLMLDLGASGKAMAVDMAAASVARVLGCPVLVNIGGDLATAGPPLAEGWQIEVQDLPDDPRQQVTLAAGGAIATSSTQKRRWSSNGLAVHHLLDPRTGFPAVPIWRSVTVASDDCLHANAYSSAAIVRGLRAVNWLDGLNVSARLVDQQGRVARTGSWPRPVDVERQIGTGDE
ncbi:MAG: FAD:protein FMN transferase [Actinomycetota bacterium]